MNLTIKTPATLNISTLAEAKQNSIITFNDDDSLITRLLGVVDEKIETDCGSVFTKKTYVLSDAIADNNKQIKLLKNTFNIISVKIGNDVIVDDNYKLVKGYDDVLKFDADYAVLPDTRYEIEFDAGYNDINLIPKQIKHASLLLISHYYNNRDATAYATNQSIEMGYKSLIAPYIYRNRV